MKKLAVALLFLLVVISMVNWQGCKTTEQDEPNPPDSAWSSDDQSQFDALLILLDESKIRFHEYLQPQNDTLAALQSLAEWYKSDPLVSFALAGPQGVSFQFKNGLRGLYFVDGKDEPEVTLEKKQASLQEINSNGLKSVPNQKLMTLINPHYRERVGYFEDLADTYQTNCYKVFENGFHRIMDDACGLYTFADLNKSGYGYVHIYSHGYAWPSSSQITEVYLMTGQPPEAFWSAKYQKDLKKGTVLVGRAEGIGRIVYWISPYFISDNNDFSKDTVLIFGGFCYSFLGGWPNLVNGFASGGYFGYNWSVQTDKNAAWAKSLFLHLSDTTTVVPWSTDGWLTQTPEIPKEYYDEEDKIQVGIKYTGDAGLTFWEPKHKYAIIAMQPSGEPLNAPGKTGIAYEFKCLDRNKEIGPGLKLKWSFSDGTASQEIEGQNTIEHTWQNGGEFKITVQVYYSSSGKLLGVAEAIAKIETYYDYLPLLQSMISVEAKIYGNGHHFFEDGSSCPDMFVFSYYLPKPEGNLIWDGQNFSVSGTYNNNWEYVSLSGYVSQDADSLLYLKAIYTWNGGTGAVRDSLYIELRNVPLFFISGSSPPYAIYQKKGVQSQSSVINLFYRKEKSWQQYNYYDHSDWEYVTLDINFASVD